MPKNERKVEMGRRKFIRTTGSGLLAILALQVIGCGTEADNFGNGLGSNPDGSAGPGDKTGFVTAPSVENHPVPGQHFAIIKRAEISKGELLILSIQGNAAHDHTISLSSKDLSDISSGIRVSRTSSDANGHYHTVTYN